MLVLDIETTGLDPGRNSIVSIGALDFDFPYYQFYEECRIPEDAKISEESLKINGFTTDSLLDSSKISLEEMLLNFFSWASKFPSSHDITIAGYNSFLDFNFLKNASKRYNLKIPFTHRIIDLHSVAYCYFLKNNFEIPKKNTNISKLYSDFIFNFVGLGDEPLPHNALIGAKYIAESFSRLLFKKNLLEEYSKFKIPSYLVS